MGAPTALAPSAGLYSTAAPVPLPAGPVRLVVSEREKLWAENEDHAGQWTHTDRLVYADIVELT